MNLHTLSVLDFREENISPSPNLPRAKNFLSTDEIDRLMIMARSAIQEEKKHISKSVESFLEALLLSEIVSLRLLAKECGARGVASDVTDSNTIKDHLENVDVDDEATIYVGKFGPCAKTPQTIFTYGENHYDADRYDKTERSGTQRVGKACDFLYWSSSIEAGIGENSGPTHKDNHGKAKTNFVDVIKVSRAQHIEIETHIIEQNLYNFWDWTSESLPVKDTDVGELVLLCRRFLVHGNLVECVGQMASILFKKVKTFKDKIAGAGESPQTTIEIKKFRTLAKRSQKSDDLSLSHN
ncbi:8131_t:CDS:2 [Acaulospora morrowiae]|uniref:8131_t:CDS:1 n=1 Tax=Acaulospora morrowiae TaxID=94023 RepID=A0A9N8ZN40_9GLOM|nr:8131_t:CDS:2 [Acaulospora morrowiae]